MQMTALLLGSGVHSRQPAEDMTALLSSGVHSRQVADQGRPATRSWALQPSSYLATETDSQRARPASTHPGAEG